MSVLPEYPNGTTVTVGMFDGVHRGHQAVLREIVDRARAAGRKSVLVTFEPHPLEVVNPQAAPPLLTSGAERREALANRGRQIAEERWDLRVVARRQNELCAEVERV